MKIRAIQLSLPRRTLTPGIMMEILRQLPLNTKILNFVDSYNSNVTHMRIESKDFKEINEYDVLPTVDIEFDENGEVKPINFSLVYNQIVWMSSISKPEEFPNLFHIDDCKYIDWKTRRYNGINGSCDIKSIQESYNKLMSDMLKSQDEMSKPKISVKSCDHIWKHYQGLNEIFDYCETCNEKK